MTKSTTLVTFLLDRSGSMSAVRDSTIESFNGYLTALKEEQDANIELTFLQFDNHGGVDCNIEKVCVAQPIATAVPLSSRTFVPRGTTPLIEAVHKTVVATAHALKLRADNPKVVICIQTDGEENCSGVEYSWAGLKALIAEKSAEGWQFNFMGAGIDAYQQGAKMGVSARQTMSYDSANLETARSAFASSAAVTRDFAAGRAKTTLYNDTMRASAGDKFAPAAVNIGAATVERSTPAAAVRQTVAYTPGGLDLSKPGTVCAATPRPVELDLSA